jgi:hypothetical protein
MVRVARIEGAGITQRAILQFDLEKDLAAVVAAANHTMALERFSLLSKDIAKLAVAVLQSANLPFHVRGIYQVEDSTWSCNPNKKSSLRDYRSYGVALIRLGIEADTPEGYAARALALIDKADSFAEEGRCDEALAAGFQLGEIVKEAGFKAIWEADALRGEKVFEGARDGALMTHGSPAMRELRNKGWLEQYEELQAAGRGVNESHKIIAKRQGVSSKTVQRNLRGLRKK